VRSVGGMATGPARPCRLSLRRGACGRRDDAFRHSEYRLPREVLDAEIARITRLGVDLQLDRRVTDVLREQADGHFDAALLAVGAHLSKRQEMPASDASRIFDALQFLKQIEFADEPLRIGRRVAVYGGGNTAMDAARTARRLGAEPLIIYRRTRNEMPAHAFELDEAYRLHVHVSRAKVP
jgi:formate dehydrogenase (NADP+) beta subunit